jgi:hypothetical protein
MALQKLGSFDGRPKHEKGSTSEVETDMGQQHEREWHGAVRCAK